MKVIALIISIAICLGAGALGTIYTIPSIPGWYASLTKPPFTPPNYLFGPAWTLLYVLMGIAAYLIWSRGSENKAVRAALGIFAAQLILNAVWTPLFFGFHWLLAAFIEIIILWLFILWTIVKFYRISSVAGLLLVPYILWVSFASVLNFSVWWLNR